MSLILVNLLCIITVFYFDLGADYIFIPLIALGLSVLMYINGGRSDD